MDSKLLESNEHKSNDVASRFVITAWAVISFFAILISFTSYYVIRSYNLHAAAEITQEGLNDGVYVNLDANSLNQSPERLSRLSIQFRVTSGAKSVALYDKQGKLIHAPEASSVINQSKVSNSFLKRMMLGFSDTDAAQTIDDKFMSFETLSSVFRNDYPLFTQKVMILTKTKQEIGSARLAMDVSFFLRNALFTSLFLFFIVGLSCLVVFYILFKKLLAVLKKLDKQEDVLNENVRNLSDLLEMNQKMRDNIQTASSRAVELNEQFLRRVGADLHDGPAQMIGYANMRLSKVAGMGAAKDLGPEFQSVKKALEDSLEEIRGISSGLVLPELKEMTLKKCLRKVISMHSVKSDAEVLENFVDIPNNIPLPIKICAYRFVQEGLNNAERHGQAQTCRVNVRYSKGKLFVSLKDNGKGFRTSILQSDTTQLGLIGLKDRIESIGGTFFINSELGVGTAIKFTAAC